jgi:hypothetical protein
MEKLTIPPNRESIGVNTGDRLHVGGVQMYRCTDIQML